MFRDNKFFKAVFIVGALGLVACGGSSDDDVEFKGTVQTVGDQSAFFGPKVAVADAQVCALSQCSFTDINGNWNFNVGDDTYQGGTVVFTVAYAGAEAATEISGLDDKSDEVIVDFIIQDDGTLFVASVRENDFDTIADEINEIGEEVEDEADSAEDSIDEEADSAEDSIDEEADSAEDSIEEEL